MANFIASQSFTTTGLCETLTSTDNSDYVNNSDGFTAANVQYKTWIFRDSGGNIIKQFTGTKNDYTCSVGISLLTFNMTLSLLVYITGKQGYTVQNTLTIPCLGV